MVQLWYYENRGTSCKKILDHVGYPSKILLFPYEGWAQPALCTYWYLKKPWWSFTKCKIIEIRGHRRVETMGRMVDDGKGGLWVTGKFKSVKEELISAPVADPPPEPSGVAPGAAKTDKVAKNQNKNKTASGSTTTTTTSRTTTPTTPAAPPASTRPSGAAGPETREYFRLFLTSNVSTEDFNLGYTMTGTLERGASKADGVMQLSHFAMIKRGGL